MKNILATISLILFGNISYSQEDSIPAYIKVCECLSEMDGDINDEGIKQKSMECILPVSGMDKVKFFDILGYVFYNCPKFPNLAAELEFERKKFDTIPFELITEDQCKNLFQGKWMEVGANEGTYGNRKDSILTQYENGDIDAVWKLVEEKGCISKFVVLENNSEFQLPPRKGDFLFFKTIGIHDEFVLTEIIMGDLRMRSVGTPYKD